MVAGGADNLVLRKSLREGEGNDSNSWDRIHGNTNIQGDENAEKDRTGAYNRTVGNQRRMILKEEVLGGRHLLDTALR